ncbi:uncharacterized protein LOC133318059 [Gastrolobium bilobum]|uniref:uncharacterized protein LOC133318059 n=1 Tax=Gastrolobium bilobum TaxID=150636 RepID=UPI002AAF31D6|nr:uncharacterized protein LOC133318059 [Gastrolobium bilobum]
MLLLFEGAIAVKQKKGRKKERMGDESPKNKVKFLCSHGGKVLPRPSDGLLKYVGGETRVISVPRDITFSELMKKVSGMVEGEIVLKYQLVPEDLDALVSVKTDEDMKHMIDEHDRHDSGMLRAFLFPSNPLLLDKQTSEPYLLEQRYIDAINGIVRTSPRERTPNNNKQHAFSACSSPKSVSPDAHTHTHTHTAAADSSPFHGNRLAMHKVRSSPSLTNLGSNSSSSSSNAFHVDTHHPSPNYPSSSRPQQDPPQLGIGIGIGMGRPPPIITMGKTDIINNRGFNYYYSTTRPLKGYAYPDDSAPYGHFLVERVNSVPRSPRKSIWE